MRVVIILHVQFILKRLVAGLGGTEIFEQRASKYIYIWCTIAVEWVCADMAAETTVGIASDLATLISVECAVVFAPLDHACCHGHFLQRQTAQTRRHGGR